MRPSVDGARPAVLCSAAMRTARWGGGVIALLLCAACGSTGDEGGLDADRRDTDARAADGGAPPLEAGTTDAAAAPDAGAGLDAEPPTDTGPAVDAAVTPDAQPPTDGALTPDAGPPRALTRWIDGPEADRIPTAPPGPALILMGGGTEVDAAFERAAQRAPGGDVVVLRASGADGYQDYLFREIGGFDSVETLLVDSRALADSPWVADRIRGAELVFLAGGDQGRYVDLWRGTALLAAVQAAWDGGAIVGGTSAGEMILGETIFAARTGGLTSAEALADPSGLDLVPALLALAPLRGLVLDSHFAQRDRFGRLVAFAAVSRQRGAGSRALGIDERTALWVEADGRAEVLGRGTAYALEVTSSTLAAGAPVIGAQVEYRALAAGAFLELPSFASNGPIRSATVSGGVLTPAAPY